MDLIPPLATVNPTTPKAQAPPPQAAGKLRLWDDPISVLTIDIYDIIGFSPVEGSHYIMLCIIVKK